MIDSRLGEQLSGRNKGQGLGDRVEAFASVGLYVLVLPAFCGVRHNRRDVEGEQISQTPNVNILWNKSRATD